MEADRWDTIWDTIIVGAGPAGCAAAAARLQRDPSARVLMLERAEFPRDKPCGDGIAAEALDELRTLDFDVRAVTAGYPAIRHLRLCSPGGQVADRRLPTPVRVIPREVFDHRLLTDVLARGAVLRRHVVRTVHVGADDVILDRSLRAATVIGADGAESTVRRQTGLAMNGPGQVAVAIRGYTAERPPRGHGPDDSQFIIMTGRHWPAYAWRFPIGDGRANVGYGELVVGGPPVSRAQLLARMYRLLPELTTEPERLRGHRLPLSTHRPTSADGRVLLVGDAASLINPLTGEGIFYAIRSGARAGRAAAHAARGADAGALYRRAMTTDLARHLRHTSLLARLSRWPRLIDAGVRGAAADQRVFDDLVGLGLAGGPITARMLVGLRPRIGPGPRESDLDRAQIY